MKVAVAGIPGAWSSERMCEALRREGIQSFVFSLCECLHDLSAGRVTFNGFDLAGLDGIVVKKLGAEASPAARLRLHILRELANHDVRIYSRPSAIDVAMDRYRMTMALVDARLPVPQTFAIESETALNEAARTLPSAVIKPVYTSKGRGMVRIGPGHTSASQEAPAAGTPTLVQEFIEAPGRDIGACILGSKFIGAFYRVAASSEWLTCTSAGGSYAPCDLPAAGRRLAESAAELFGLDYTVVDLVETRGGYLVYEVSAFGGFRGLWEASRYDVAAKYARYVKWDLLG